MFYFLNAVRVSGSKANYLELLIVGGTFLPELIVMVLLGIPGVGVNMSGLDLVLLFLRFRNSLKVEVKRLNSKPLETLH